MNSREIDKYGHLYFSDGASSAINKLHLYLGDLKFLKNRMKTAKAAHHQAMKKTHHHSWKGVHGDKAVHKQLSGGPVGISGLQDPQASTIQLWPPFSVANTNTVMPVQVPTYFKILK